MTVLCMLIFPVERTPGCKKGMVIKLDVDIFRRNELVLAVMCYPDTVSS